MGPCLPPRGPSEARFQSCLSSSFSLQPPQKSLCFRVPGIFPETLFDPLLGPIFGPVFWGSRPRAAGGEHPQNPYVFVSRAFFRRPFSTPFVGLFWVCFWGVSTPRRRRINPPKSLCFRVPGSFPETLFDPPFWVCFWACFWGSRPRAAGGEKPRIPYVFVSRAFFRRPFSTPFLGLFFRSLGPAPPPVEKKNLRPSARFSEKIVVFGGS